MSLRGAILLLAMLAGCVGPRDDRDDNHGYGFQYDLSTLDGLRFRNHPPVTVLDQGQMEQAIAEPYHQVEACMQVMTGGPLVVVVSNDALGSHGYIYFDDGLILMADSSAQDGLTQATSGGPLSMMKHEFVHYLLNASGFPEYLNATHQSPLFVQCAGL